MTKEQQIAEVLTNLDVIRRRIPKDNLGEQLATDLMVAVNTLTDIISEGQENDLKIDQPVRFTVEESEYQGVIKAQRGGMYRVFCFDPRHFGLNYWLPLHRIEAQ